MNKGYQWQGINHLGQRVHGREIATNSKNLKERLQNRDIVVLTVKKNLAWRKPFSTKISIKIIADFTRQLAILCVSNLELVQALQILSSQDTHPALQNLIVSIKKHIENGLTFSQTLAKFPQYFDHVFCGLIQAGEQSGTLGQMLTQLADHQEQILNLKTKIIKTLFYPLTILVVAMLITSGLLIFVVPQFENIFKNFGAELPLFTQMIIHFSNKMRSHFLIISIVLILLMFVYLKSIKHSPGFCTWRDRQLLRIPVIGKLLLTSLLAQWTRILATLLAAGLPLLAALQMAANTITHQTFQNALLEVIKQINNGQTFGYAIQNNSLFPQRVVQMISVGENSGQMVAMLYKISEVQQISLDRAIDYSSKWLEPALMLLIAAITSALIVAMYLPVFRLGAAI